MLYVVRIPSAMGIAAQLAPPCKSVADERTPLAWICTCLSRIRFGFGLVTVMGAINAPRPGGSNHLQLGVRLITSAFVVTRALAMAAANHQPERNLWRLLREDFTNVVTPSSAAATTLMNSLIGLSALVLLLLRSLLP